MIPLNSNSNYYEIYLTSNLKHDLLDKEAMAFKIDISKDEFDSMLQTISNANTNYKFFQKEYKEYKYNEVTLHNYKNEETRVFKFTPQVIYKNDNAFLIGYQRNKLTFLSVPSTTSIYEISYIKKLIFRVNNRIFLNFQCNYTDDTKIYTIYINYNHEANIDPDGVNNAIKTIFDIFGYNKELIKHME
jgi:nuclear transport factor 2 (NTF2) superfamily protein